MKIPCEVIVWYVLPSLRRELAIELINEHGVSQKQAAKILDLTTAAVCQYVNDKRGKSLYDQIKDKDTEKLVRDQITSSAKIIINNPEKVVSQVCLMCNILKREGVITNYYKAFEKGPIPHDVLCFK